MLHCPHLSVMFVALLGLVGALAAPPSAAALGPGDTVVFLVPADANQPEPPEGIADKLVYAGGRVTNEENTDVTGGCPIGSWPVQNALLVDATGGRSGRTTGVITMQTDPVPPGTRLEALTKQNTCTIEGAPYVRYSGIVE